MFNKILPGLVLALAVAGNLYADGGGGDGGYSGVKVAPEYKKAVKAIKKEDYAQAIDLLQTVIDDDPEDANAWNYLGYSLRKQGRFDEALIAYQKALAIKPRHKGALEYLGELYLQTDQPEKARAQLEKLDKACFFSCKEYRMLKEKIAQYDAS